MFRRFRPALLCLAAIFAIFAIGGTATAASYPDDAPRYKLVRTYVKVVVYEVQEVAYTKVVVQYDCYDKPVYVRKTFYRDIEVPVVKVVEVVRKVPICD